MYSFAPFPDTSADHLGFYLVVLCCIILYATWLYVYIISPYSSSNPGEGCTTSFIVTTIIVLGALPVSYNISYSDMPPRNEKVPAELVGFEAEGFRQKTNKNRHVNKHLTYVVYSVPNEGHVMLSAHQNTAYPEKTILYKK